MTALACKYQKSILFGAQIFIVVKSSRFGAHCGARSWIHLLGKRSFVRVTITIDRQTAAL